MIVFEEIIIESFFFFFLGRKRGGREGEGGFVVFLQIFEESLRVFEEIIIGKGGERGKMVECFWIFFFGEVFF